MNEKAIKKIEKGISDLQEQLTKLKEPEFKSGWYKNTVSKSILTYFNFEDDTFYGLNSSGWHTSDDSNIQIELATEFFSEGFDRPATNSEVEAALIAEAKKRGFKKGVLINQVPAYGSCGGEHIAKDNKFLFTYHSDYTNLSYGGIGIFNTEDGKWAEIITEPKVTINGYDMKQEGDYVVFGCAKFHHNRLRELNNTVLSWESLHKDNDRVTSNPLNNRYIKSITLDSGVEITVEQLKQIVDNIK